MDSKRWSSSKRARGFPDSDANFQALNTHAHLLLCDRPHPLCKSCYSPTIEWIKKEKHKSIMFRLGRNCSFFLYFWVTLFLFLARVVQHPLLFLPYHQFDCLESNTVGQAFFVPVFLYFVACLSFAFLCLAKWHLQSVPIFTHNLFPCQNTAGQTFFVP